MLDQNKIERLFYAIDELATIFSTKKGMNAIEGMVVACGVIFAENKAEDEEIKKIIDSIRELKPGKEEIRKAYQLAILKALKKVGRSNSFITPDTVGVLVAYLVERLVKEKEPVVFDPLVGTGNLLASVVDNLGCKPTAIGCDNDDDCYALASSLMNMLGQKADIYLEDTFSVNGIKADVIVTDFPFADESDRDYFPYKVLEHHYDNLVDSGYVVSVIPNDFFDITDTRDYRDSILAKYLAIGLIKLPDDLFKKLGKSILILRKKTDMEKKNENFLIAEIPSFADSEEFKKTIAHINNWLERYIDGKDK